MKSSFMWCILLMLVSVGIAGGWAMRVDRSGEVVFGEGIDRAVGAHPAGARGQGSREVAWDGVRRDEHVVMDLDFSSPFAMQYAKLASRADKGDLQASCMLVRGLDYCASRDRLRSDLMDAMDTAAVASETSPINDATMNHLVVKDESAARADVFCGGLQVPFASELARRTYQAAEQGDVGAMLRFGLDPPLGGDINLGNAEIAAIYRKEAPRLLQKAAMMGSLEAVRAIFEAQLRGAILGDYGVVPVEHDPDLLLAAAAVMRRFDGAKSLSAIDHTGRLRALEATPPTARAMALRSRMEKALADRMVSDPGSVRLAKRIDHGVCR